MEVRIGIIQSPREINFETDAAPDEVRATLESALAEGKQIFADNCSSCHGDDGKGVPDSGAADLTDRFWIYGGDFDTVRTTIYSGRQGHMPSWEGRLSDYQRKLLALYVLDLRSKEAQ